MSIETAMLILFVALVALLLDYEKNMKGRD